MKKLRTLLTVFILIALPVSLVGCGVVGALRTNQAEISSNSGEELPEWLTVAHRVQAAEQPEIDTEVDESKENDAGPLVNQPASTQPGLTQPAQQDEQLSPATGTPRWKQPGTMEYIAKQQLDKLVFTYKRLNSNIADLESEKDKNEEKLNDLKAKIKERSARYEIISEIAGSIGLSLVKEYGINPPPPDTTETTNSTWFQNWNDSPSGFGD